MMPSSDEDSDADDTNPLYYAKRYGREALFPTLGWSNPRSAPGLMCRCLRCHRPILDPPCLDTSCRLKPFIWYCNMVG